MTFATKNTGNLGEDLAADFIKKKKFNIINRNLRTPFGEIDILAEFKKIIVLVEVKTKRGSLFGLPQDMVHTHKQHKLRQLALWLTQKYPKRQIRIDVIAIDLENPSDPKIEHLENALEG